MKLSSEEIKRYNRQIILPNFGEEAQTKLKAAKVLVVGIGGLGSVASLYLTAAGFGTVGIMVDVAREGVSYLVQIACILSLSLGLFNLIPARPLDGGRILWLVIAWITEPFTADRVVFFTSVLFAAALLILGAAVLIRTGKSPFLLLAAFGVLAAVLREKGLVKRPPAR